VELDRDEPLGRRQSRYREEKGCSKVRPKEVVGKLEEETYLSS
jgi:hypothetical protein